MHHAMHTQIYIKCTIRHTRYSRRGYSESTNTDKQQAQRQVPYHSAVGLSWLCATPAPAHCKQSCLVPCCGFIMPECGVPFPWIPATTTFSFGVQFPPPLWRALLVYACPWSEPTSRPMKLCWRNNNKGRNKKKQKLNNASTRTRSQTMK